MNSRKVGLIRIGCSGIIRLDNKPLFYLDQIFIPIYFNCPPDSRALPGLDDLLTDDRKASLN